MKATVCLLAFVLVAVAAENPKPELLRQKRGFKATALQTARGFGKRTSALEELGLSPSEAESGESPSDYIGSRWFASQVAQNPDLIQMLINKYIDADGDGRLTHEELFRKNKA